MPSMKRIVKGACKSKVAAPKAKYVEPILLTTYDETREFEQVMDQLSREIQEGFGWPQAYKAILMIHIMIREGQEGVTLKYLARHSSCLNTRQGPIASMPVVTRYARYLQTRAEEYSLTKIDYVRFKSKSGHGRLYALSVEKGLLRECESVITQLDKLLKCNYEEDQIENDIQIMNIRLLVHDLLSLFQVLNEGVINLLEHYFELSRVDAEHALSVYKAFTLLTTKVITYLRVAKNLEHVTKFKVPNIKHAPTSLVSSLEMYLNDPDFEVNRRQYLAEKQAHLDRRDSHSALHKQLTPQQRQISAQLVPANLESQPAQAQQPVQSVQPAQQSQGMQQAQTGQQFQNQPSQFQSQSQPQQFQNQPHQFDLLDFGQNQPQTQATDLNPFFLPSQQESVQQLQAKQIQVEQMQAQQQQQQLMAQQQALQQQLTGYYQQQQQQQQQQPMYTQPLSSQPTASLPDTQNPFKRMSFLSQQQQQQQQQLQYQSTQQMQYQQQQQQMQPQMQYQPTQTQPTAHNPMAYQQTANNPFAQITHAQTGSNPFRTSVQ